MTRINLVNPSELSDQHLVAEYREIFMVGSSLQRSIRSSNWDRTRVNLPRNFTLNSGHVKFFYDKGKYLHLRYLSLIEEMMDRGMKPDLERKFKTDQWPPELYNDWEPDERDKEIVRQRIKQKISQKKNWYRWTAKIINTKT